MADPADGFVDVYSKKTGRKHRIPAHHLEHPVLKKPWRKTPMQRAADGETPAGSATPITDVVTAASGRPPSTTETPATGDEKE